LAQTKVGEAYVEIFPRLARDFAKRLRDDIEKKLSPLGDDIGKNVGASLGDSIGESFSERFGDHAYDAIKGLDLGGAGSGVGERLGDQVAEGFRDQVVPGVERSGVEIETTLTRHFERAAISADRSGRDIDASLRQHLASAASGTSALAKGFGSLASSAVLATGQLSATAGALGAAAQSALALSAAIAPAVGAFAALPGGLLLGAAALGTLKVGLSGVGEGFAAAISGDYLTFIEGIKDLRGAAGEVAYELFQMAPAFQGIKSAVQDAIFAPLVGEMWDLLPLLNALDDGMTGVARVFGEVALEIVKFGQDVQTVSAVDSIFHSLRDSIAEVVPEIDILLAGFRDVGVVGAGWLASLAPGIADAANELGWFLYNAAASGDALRWMEEAAEVFRQLGAIIGDVVGIVRALFRAMNEAGGDALGVLGSLVSRVREFLDSAQGQDTLVAIFTALADIGSALLPVVTALALGLGSLAPTIGQIAQLIGPILTTAVNALSPALAILGPALVTVFTELGSAVTILAQNGALQNIASALASILIAVAPLLPPLAQLVSLLLEGLAYVITTWVAPALSQLVTWLSDAVNWLTGTGLSEDMWLSRTISYIYETVAPLFQQAWEIIQTVANDLVTWFTENQSTVEEWGTKLESIFSRLGEIISGVFEFIAWAWDNFGGPLLNIIGNVFTGILGVVDGILTAVHGVIEFILGVITGDWERAWEGIKTFAEGIWNGLVSIFETIWNNFLEQFKAILALFDDDWEKHWEQFSQFAEDIWDSIVDWISDRVDDIGDILDWFGSLPGKFSQWFGEVKNAVVSRFNDVLSFVQSIPGRITGFFSNAGTWLYNAGREIVNGLWNGIVSLWNWVVSQWDSMVTGLINTVKSILGIASPSRVMHEMGVFLGQGLARGITASARLVDQAVTGLAEGVTDAWGSPELSVPAWQNPSVGRLPATTPAAGDGLITNGVAGNVYQIDLHAIPTVPTERQIVDALDYADALYATT
jgi:phage-related protein